MINDFSKRSAITTVVGLIMGSVTGSLAGYQIADQQLKKMKPPLRAVDVRNLFFYSFIVCHFICNFLAKNNRLRGKMDLW